jgi:hypothetical protein
MAVIDTIREAQERSIEGITSAQERLAELNEQVAENVLNAVPSFDNPFAEYLPSPSELVDSYFDFVGKLYEANRAFTERLTKAWERPEATPAKPKTTTSRSRASAKS